MKNITQIEILALYGAAVFGFVIGVLLGVILQTAFESQSIQYIWGSAIPMSVLSGLGMFIYLKHA